MPGTHSVIWNQTYLLFGHGLAVSCLIASIPVLTLVLLLGVFRKPAWMASPIGLLATLLVAVLAYHMPLRLTISAAANGAAFAVFPILWIIFWAISLFRVCRPYSSPLPSRAFSRVPQASAHLSPLRPVCLSVWASRQ